MEGKPVDTEVLFIDAVHPEHNAQAAYGWFKRGQKRELKTNSGRQRLNLHGAINAETTTRKLVSLVAFKPENGFLERKQK